MSASGTLRHARGGAALSEAEHRNAVPLSSLLRHAPLLFHIENGHRISGDEGVEFPDDKTALKEAQVIADDRGRAKEPVRWVADEDIGWGQRQVAAQKRSKTDV